IAAMLASAAGLTASTCESLKTLKLPATTNVIAQSLPTGVFKPAEGPVIAGLPGLCRVAALLKPSSDSDIQFEVWMPNSGWNGKFYGIGIGAYAGSVHFDDLAGAVRHGYAAVSTDTG